MGNPDQLRILYKGQSMGTVVVKKRFARKFFGRLDVDASFDLSGSLLDEARRLAGQFDQSHSGLSLDYQAFDLYVDVVKRLTSQISLPDFPFTIEEFAVNQDLDVEVTFTGTDNASGMFAN